jgi:ketosteroid isomerase-like protein
VPDAQQRARELMAVWETGDTQPLDTMLADSAVYDDYPNGEQYRGTASIAEYVAHVHSWASNIRFDLTRVAGGPSTAVVERVMHGVQDRPIGTRVAIGTNRTIELRKATIVEVRNGRITRAADYMDVLGFVLQLGAGVDLPGGAHLGAVAGAPPT